MMATAATLGSLLLCLGLARSVDVARALVTVTTIAGGGGGGDKCTAHPGLKDGLASEALFNLPARLQAVTMPDGVSERLFVLDIHNGCVRSLPLGVAPGRTFVRSETPCGPSSPPFPSLRCRMAMSEPLFESSQCKI